MTVGEASESDVAFRARVLITIIILYLSTGAQAFVAQHNVPDVY